MRRCLRLLKDAHPLNLLKMKEEMMDKSMFKRHSVPRMDFRQRAQLDAQTPRSTLYNSYLKAVNETFPKMESMLESDIVSKYKEHLSPLEQEELERAWNRRKEVTEKTEKKPREYIPRNQSGRTKTSSHWWTTFTSVAKAS